MEVVKTPAQEFLEFLDFASSVLGQIQHNFVNDPIFQRECLDLGAMDRIRKIRAACEQFQSVAPGSRSTVFDGVQQR